MKKQIVAFFSALCIVFTFFVFSVSPVAASTKADYCVEPIEQEFLRLINNYRSTKGVGPLTMSWTLAAAAQHHAIDMAMNFHFSHTLSDGTTWYQNIVNHGYIYSGRGENIAWGYPTAQQVFDAWRNSPTHEENMRWSSFKVIGIDRSVNPSHNNYPTWVTTFGSTLDGDPPPVCGSSFTPTPALTSEPTAVPTSAPTRTPTPTPSGPVDNISPSTSITFPLNGATVARRSKVTVTASATDNVGVSRVDFYIDGKRKCSDSTVPYNCLWSVGNKPNANYTLYTQAYDAAGNSGRSANVTVNTSR